MNIFQFLTNFFKLIQANMKQNNFSLFKLNYPAIIIDVLDICLSEVSFKIPIVIYSFRVASNVHKLIFLKLFKLNCYFNY